MQLTTHHTVSLAQGETLRLPVIFPGVDLTGCAAHWTVAKAPGATPVLDMSIANGLLTLVVATLNGVPTSTITALVADAVIAAIPVGEYQHDFFLRDTAGDRSQILGPAAWSITAPITVDP